MIFNYLAKLRADNWYHLIKAEKIKHSVATLLLNIFYKEKYALYLEVVESRRRIRTLELKCKTLDKKLDAAYIAVAHYAPSSSDADNIIGRGSIEPDNKVYCDNHFLAMDDSLFMNTMNN